MDRVTMRTVAVLLACAATAFLSVPARAAATAGQRCAAAKVKAVATDAAGILVCASKGAAHGIAADGACVDKQRVKLATAFSRAEAKGSCATTGDAAALTTLVDDFVGAVVGDLPPGETSDGERCAAAKLKAVAKEAKDALGCEAKAVGVGRTVDAACGAKAVDKLTRSFVTADGRWTC